MEIRRRQYCALMHVSQSGIVHRRTLCGAHPATYGSSVWLRIAVGGLLGNVLVPRAGTDEVFDCFNALNAAARANRLAVQRRCGTSKVQLSRQWPTLQ